MLALLFCHQKGAKTCIDVIKRITIAFTTRKRGKPLESKSWPVMATGAKCVSGPGA